MLAFLAGCGGGNTVPAMRPPAISGSTTTGASRATAAVMLKIPANRTPAYVSPATAGVTIAAYGAFATPPPTATAYDVSSSSSLCTTGSDGSRTCSLTISAPAGNDNFKVSAYDMPPASGVIPTNAHALSSGTTQAAIVAGASNTISLALGGIIAGIAIAPPAYDVPSGSAGSAPFTVAALDAQHNVIIGSDAFVNPITLTLTDATCATFSFASGSTCETSQTLTTASTTGPIAVPVYFNGHSFSSTVTLQASTTTASGTVSATSTLLPGTAGGTLTVPVPAFLTGPVAVAVTGAIEIYAGGYTASSVPVQTIPVPSGAIGKMVFDKYGNLYTENEDNGAIGIWTAADVVAGNSTPSYSIASPSITEPYSIGVDSYGNVYVSAVPAGSACVEAVPSHSVNRTARPIHPDCVEQLWAVYGFYPSTYQSGGEESTYTGPADWELAGSATGLNTPDLALDPSNDLIAANYAGSCSGSITIYAPGATGNTAPLATITDTIADPGWVVSGALGNILVSDDSCSVSQPPYLTGLSPLANGANVTFVLGGTNSLPNHGANTWFSGAVYDAAGNVVVTQGDGAGSYLIDAFAPGGLSGTIDPSPIGTLSLGTSPSWSIAAPPQSLIDAILGSETPESSARAPAARRR